MPLCTRCKVEKSESEFYEHRSKGRLQHWCKQCFSEHKAAKYAEDPRKALDRQRARRLADPERFRFLEKQRREANPERYREMQRRWYHANLEKARATRRRSALKARGLDQESFDRLLLAQGMGCAICGKGRGIALLCVDHDHDTDQVRGILCRDCNSALGLFKDDPWRVQQAADYLSSFYRPLREIA